MPIEIVNLRNCPDFGTRPGDVRVDRSTKWGNPFKMGPGMPRDKACDEYEKWIIDQVAYGKLDIAEIAHAQRLGCWCAPARCHAESLRTLIVLSKKQVIM